MGKNTAVRFPGLIQRNLATCISQYLQLVEIPVRN